jgi:hypothetical protein
VSEVIFTTVHGSRLYGFAHADSDFDTYTVTTSTRTRVRQTVDEAGNDRVMVGLDRFLDLAYSGSHQSVEALFSPVKEWADTAASAHYRPMLDSIRIGGADVYAKYERTIRAFSYGDFKRRRHAVRLASNLRGLRYHGRFNPRLGRILTNYCTTTAHRFEGDDLAQELLR